MTWPKLLHLVNLHLLACALVIADLTAAKPNLCVCLLQPIQLETAPGCVVTALMHMIEGEQAGIADTRACAMHAYDPIHTMMFDNEGTLLTANKAALEAYHIDTSGESAPWCCIASEPYP